MAPRKPTQPPQRQVLTPTMMRQAIERLNQRILEVESFDPSTITRRWDPKVKAIETSIEETLSRIFGDGTPEYRRYIRASGLDHGPIFMGGGEMPPFQVQEILKEGKEEALALLAQAVRGLSEELSFAPPDIDPHSVAVAPAPTPNRRVFVVHGHDDGAKESVARYLEKLTFQVVILHEQASQGRTVIEKIEAEGDVGFAVVLLTPDDVGGPAGGTQQPRARQNVMLELGYFIGKLGRSRVCALKKGDLEVPSDFGGVVYTGLDSAGAWKTELAKELKAAGFSVDWNKVME